MLGLPRRLLVGRDDCGPKGGAVDYRSLAFSPEKICEYRIGAEIEPRGHHNPKRVQPISCGPVQYDILRHSLELGVCQR
jgi:hypothetical protein